MRTLVVIRHAQAGAHTASDHERPLTERGEGQANVIGRFLAPILTPETVVVSSATRTQQTWRTLASAAGFEVEPTVSDDLYNAGVDDALGAIRRLSPTVGQAIVIGHNPTMSAVGSLLDDGADSGLSSKAPAGFPTGGTAVFSIDGDWADVDDGSGHLRDFLAP